MIAGTRLSFGAVVLALAPAALFVRSQRRLAVWSLALAGVSAALALGSSTWLLDVYLALPGIGWFRQTHRLLFLSQFAGAVACGIAFDGLLRRDCRPALPVAIAGLLSAISWLGGATGAAIAAAAAGLALALWWGRPRIPVRMASALLLGVAAIDLMVSLPLREPLPYGARWAARYDRDTAVYEHVAALVGSDRAVWLLHRDQGVKLAERYGVRRVGGFEAFSFERQEQYFRYLQYAIPGSPMPGLFFSGGVLLPRDPAGESPVAWYQGIASRRRLLDLAAARWFVVPVRLSLDEADAGRSFLVDAKLRRHGPAGDDFTVYENPAALPRAFVTYRAAPAPDADALLARLSRPDFDPLWQSYVQGDPGFDAHPGAPARGHPAAIVRDDADAVEIEADLAAPGLVVLADAYGGGWRAQVDGEDATIVATNHLFRGVRAPAGHHRVRFAYRAPGLAAGAGASLLGIAALVFLTWRSIAPASRPHA